jgi:hypothetical protein
MLFKFITKSQVTIGVQASMSRTAELVSIAQEALMFERIRDGVSKTSVTLGELFVKHDTNRDNLLELPQIEDFLLELKVFVSPNAMARLKGILDAENRGKLSLGVIKKYFSGDPAPSGLLESAEP